MPQSSRTMVTFCARRCQRADSADAASCGAPAGTTSSSSARATAFSMPRLYSAAGPDSPPLHVGLARPPASQAGLHGRLRRAGDEQTLHVLRRAHGTVEAVDIGPHLV